MLKKPTKIGLNDPLTVKTIEGQLAQQSIIANGKQTINDSKVISPYTTVSATSNTVTTTTSTATNIASDTTTTYSTTGNIYVSSINQTIRNTSNGISGYSGFSGFSGVNTSGAAVPQVFYFSYTNINSLGNPVSPVTADVLYTAPQTHVDLDSTSIQFLDSGTYEVNIQGQLVDQANNGLWYTFKTSYGPKLVTDTSMSVVNLQDYFEHFTSTDSHDDPFLINGPSFNDTFIVQTATDQLLDIQLWLYSFYAEGEEASGNTVVTITRLSSDSGPWV